ncbi:lipid droplet phospholipase 1-like [Trifolium pratense]|uniref:lipid droplet phospholipase 1-like n=1 Tax=Trifolium pratense TaxID=57577 RepID=UPI001E697B10|nr:lipid droplet phospholipase 1-like [Trifolium pratense]
MADEITPIHDEQQRLSVNAEPSRSTSDVVDHLVVMVHGMKGSEKEWMYVSEQLVKQFPEKVFIHCSKQNEGKRTYDGVDVMGERLANEVVEVIQRQPSMRKISFIAYSVGGLVARYAIGQLYKAPENETENEADSIGTIGGLLAMNFITLATPHLGSSGHLQVPILFGRTMLEKIASIVAPCIVGKTGRHLFLTDGTQRKDPLLLRMVKDSDEGYFMSALRAFERRVVYSNIVNDYIVGWRTSSIRGDRAYIKVC